MRVLLGPRALPNDGSAETEVARALAGREGLVVSLAEAGVTDLSRPITQAEVALLRESLVGQEAFQSRSWTREHPGDSRKASLVGYVCGGEGQAAWSAGASEKNQARATRVVAVADHVNLTWRSPLRGRNDDSVGPRFPSMNQIYAPEMVRERLSAEQGIIVRLGVVAGVGCDERLDTCETETVRVSRYLAVSSELVPVAIVAAHMGLRIAAAVVTMGKSPEEESGSGRS